MSLDFTIKDVIHRILAKFFPAYLPNAKKKYILRTVYQPELDIHDIASKAEVYNITTAPKVIEDGMNAGLDLITYLVADGYKIKTKVFNIKIVIPSEYDGSETHLPSGVMPQGRVTLAPELKKYIEQHVSVQIDGVEETNGMIAEIVNHVTGEVDLTINAGGIFYVRGSGLKIESEELYASKVGLFLEDADTGERTRIDNVNIALNTPRELRAIAPATIPVGKQFYVVVCTQLSAKNSTHLLKNIREMKSDFTIIIQ